MPMRRKVEGTGCQVLALGELAALSDQPPMGLKRSTDRAACNFGDFFKEMINI